MKKILTGLLILLVATFLYASYETETYYSKTIDGQPSMVKKIIIQWVKEAEGGTYVDTNGCSVTLNEIYGYIDRVTVDSNGTELVYGVALADSDGYTIFTAAELNSVEEPNSFALHLDDQAGGAIYGTPVGGTLTLTTDGIVQNLEVQTASPNAAISAGPFAFTYNDETTPQVSEVVTISEVNDPNGLNYTLTFGGQTTSELNFDVNAAEVDRALEALASIPTSGVTVAGGPHPNTPIVVTFAGALGEQNVGAVTFSDVNLTALDQADTASFAIAVTTAGDGLVYDNNTLEIERAFLAFSAFSTSADFNVTGQYEGEVEDGCDLIFTFAESSGDVNMLTCDFDTVTGGYDVTITETTEGGSTLDLLKVIIYYRQEPQ